MKEYIIVKTETTGLKPGEEPVLTDRQIDRLARPLLDKIPQIIEFYKDPKNVKAYEEWYFKKYGRYPED